MCSPDDVQAVKDALDRNPNNAAVGIIHEPTGRIFLKPFDDVPGGHAQLAGDQGLPLNEAKGFVIRKHAGGYQAINVSHLNNAAGQGATGSMQMPADLFDAVVQKLKDAGL
jgi:hypothetical protein